MENTKNYRTAILNAYLSAGFYKMQNNIPFIRPKYIEKIFSKIIKYNYFNLLPKKKEIKILELGPGTGHFINFLKKNGYKNIESIDGSVEVVKYLNNNGFIAYLTENFSDFLNKQREVYDVIIACDIFEHFTKEELFALIINIHKALKPSGCIIGKVPNASSCFLGSHTRFGDFTHELSFTEHSLEQIFTSAGFSKVELFEKKLFCFFYNPVNYLGLIGNFILKYIQIFIYRINGIYNTTIVSSDIIFKITK